MLKLAFYLFIIGLVNAQETCLTVKKGNQFSAILTGANTNTSLSSWIKFDANCATYLFESNDPQGKLCSTSWNKLWGTVRCGMLNSNHKDSDRFIWRRAQSCLIYNSSFVIGEVTDCGEKDLIEVAAYTYDNGDIPYLPENQGRLLKIFKTKLKIETWYKFALLIFRTFTAYEIYDANGNLIEQESIEHRDCGSGYQYGVMQK